MDAWRLTRVFAAATATLGVAACAQQPRMAGAIQPVSYTSADRECMARAMYFESHRGADEGMVAVGTVVANRKDSGRYGSSICEVVGQKRQFAAGVMSRTMEGEAAERARRNADKVLSGNRHPALKTAMFFHTAGYKFRYPNMHYVLVAGGNAFYEKREVVTAADARDNARSKALALAYARINPTGASKSIMVASNEASRPVAAQPAPVAVATVQTVAQPAAPQLAAVAAPAPAKPVVRETQVAAVVPAPVASPVSTQKTVAAPKAVVVASATPPAPLAYAAAAEPSAAVKAVTPKKRVLQPSKLAPALASSAPVAAAAKPEVKAETPAPVAVAAPEPSRSYAYNGEVAAAFAAFNGR